MGLIVRQVARTSKPCLRQVDGSPSGGRRELTLLDPSPSMRAPADAAVQGCSIAPEIVDAAMEDYRPDSRYSVILAAHVDEHSHDSAAAFRRFSDWLEPRGRLVMVVSRPHWCNWLIWPCYRHRWYSEGEMVGLGGHAKGTHQAAGSGKQVKIRKARANPRG
jgi:SAM-dependent methyltransferase